MGLRAKLLLAFAVVLAPVLGMLLWAFHAERESQREAQLDAQLMMARAVGAQVDQAFEAALGVGWAVAQDPVVRSMDPAVLDDHLRRLRARMPLYHAINVFDAQGVNRGWGHDSAPREPRLEIGDRRYFQRVMETGEPVISDGIQLRQTQTLGFVVSVPILDDAGKTMGVVNVVARTDLLARAWARGLEEGHVVLLADRSGRLFFATSHPELEFDETERLLEFAPLHQALEGGPVQVRGYYSPLLGEERLGAFIATPRHGWVVGVTLSRTVAEAPTRTLFERQLLAWGGLVLLTLLLALALARLLTGPVQRLEAQSRAIGEGRLGQRVEIRSGDELERLGDAFNDMASRLAGRERELARAHAELVRRERLAAVGELAAAVAHEIRNPLGVIFNAVSALRRNIAPEEAKGLYDMLQEEADRLNRMVGDLLDFTRPFNPTFEPTGLRALLSAAIAGAVGGEGDPAVAVEVAMEDGLPPVALDPRLMRQALINVLVNAAQAMTNGGKVEVRVRREGPFLQIDVRDAGPGIPPEVRARMFEPFFTTKATGTGLGLAVVKRILESHGGSVSFESAPGQGTVFSLRLPLERPEGAGPLRAPDTRAPVSGGTSDTQGPASSVRRG